MKYIIFNLLHHLPYAEIIKSQIIDLLNKKFSDNL